MLINRFLPVLLLVAAGVVSAQSMSGNSTSVYPSKPIRMVVPYPSGGSSDVIARIIGQSLGQALGQPVVIENQPGASGLIGKQMVARAIPDGHTLIVATDTLVVLPSLHAEKIFDPVKDFAPISLMASVPFLLVVSPSLPANTVKELIELAKAKPGQLNYASSGLGSSTQLAAEQFKSMTGTDLVNVSYKGTAAAITDLLSGQVHIMFSGISAFMPHLKAGRVKGLAVGSAKRVALLSDTPTVSEAGVPGFNAATWIGLLAPAKTSSVIIARLNREVVNMMATPAIKERLFTMGAESVTNTPEQFMKIIETDMRYWEKIIKDAGIKAE